MLTNERNQGKDATLEPAYFAKRPRRQQGSDNYEELREEIRKIKIQIGELQDECDKLSDNVDDLSSDVDNINNSITNLQLQIDALNAAIQGLSQFDCRMENQTLIFYKTNI